MGSKEKDTYNGIQEGDVCMLYTNKFPSMFVRINWIWPDEKPGWYCISLTLLALPLESWIWKLDESHINCNEWTMNGVAMQFQILERPDLSKEEEAAHIQKSSSKIEKPKPALNAQQKVVSLFGRDK